jgi:16S rRNA (guanine966-N2)-methyltransferase
LKNNSFNIIAGKYRRSKFDFIGDITLRPTPNKVRETLFNWLQFDIIDKSVLEPFAGSGALSFEAISRGAKSVVMVEKNPQTAKIIQQNTNKIDGNIALINADFFTQKFNQVFDIILLDPPFNCGLIEKSLDFIITNNLANSQTLIYLESEFEVKNDNLEIIKQKKSANVFYCLAKTKI